MASVYSTWYPYCISYLTRCLSGQAKMTATVNSLFVEGLCASRTQACQLSTNTAVGVRPSVTTSYTTNIRAPCCKGRPLAFTSACELPGQLSSSDLSSSKTGAVTKAASVTAASEGTSTKLITSALIGIVVRKSQRVHRSNPCDWRAALL